jgi:hypothetical protein
MKNRILHLIEPTFDFGSINKTSTLITSVDTPIDSDEYHTSLGDISSLDIIKISSNFSTINFVDNKFNRSSNIYKETVILLNSLSWLKNVTNFTVDLPISFAEPIINNRPDGPTLWVFGCSHSHGVGLLPDEKKFAEIVAESLNLPLMLISKPASSLSWSTRNLVAADIRHNDIVIWQHTTPHRLSRYNGSNSQEIMLSHTHDRHLLEVFNDKQVFFDQINLLNFGVRYLRGIGVKFVIISLISKLENFFYEYLIEYSKYPEYCYTPGYQIDLGTDKQHAGPLSHKALAQRLLDHI